MKSLTLQKSIDFKVPTGVLAAGLLNDDKQLALGCMDGVYIAELETRSSHQIGTHDSYVSSVVSVPTHKLIVHLPGGETDEAEWRSGGESGNEC